jgi:glycosyltransferase involved in cell wall biosynthesis
MLPDRFVFTGPVPDEELAVYYRRAAVYVSLSEHEGFCVPLLEAMAADVPVLAYAAGRGPDTLGGAGVQFAPKDLEYAAELLAPWPSTTTCAPTSSPASGGGLPISATRALPAT